MVNPLQIENIKETVNLHKAELKKERNELLKSIFILFSIGILFLGLVVVLVLLFKPESESFDDLSLYQYSLIPLAAVLGLIMFWLTNSRTYRKQKKVIYNAYKNYHLVNQMISNQKPFVLFLYDFDSGADTISMKGPPVAGTSGEYSIDGNHRRAAITRKLHKKIPVISLYNSRESNYRYKDISLIVNNDNWFEVFTYLYQNADYVIMDYRDKFASSTNIQREIEHILKNPDKTILYSGTEDELSKMVNLHPGIDKIISAKFPLKNLRTHAKYYGEDIGSEYLTIDADSSVFDEIIDGSLKS
ncbi:MAG: hypothetical protein MI810_08540 [Flavobacteriales bacterium]|nr:hypothetical protein [Flavobacteriales bacterium]